MANIVLLFCVLERGYDFLYFSWFCAGGTRLLGIGMQMILENIAEDTLTTVGTLIRHCILWIIC